MNSLQDFTGYPSFIGPNIVRSAQPLFSLVLQAGRLALPRESVFITQEILG